ncbi:hypothetical protein ACFQDG_04205 [Natronoarchaeum mannanilyticum]
MRFQNRIVGPIQESLEEDPGIDVMARDWDNLLVLDACRSDLFEATIDLDKFDAYEVVRSQASATPEWMEENFAGETFGDTVYVSGNPWVSKIAPDAFHDIVNIWLEDFDIEQEELAEVEVLNELGMTFGETVPAERVNEAALEAAEQYPDKRLIVHYFQPHAPFVGNPDGSRKDAVPDIHPGRPLAAGEIEREEVWSLYRENLEYVWHHAETLTEELGGKSVVTSDHGEMFGERLSPFPIRGYAHPIGLRSPELVDVPWAEIQHGDRRSITNDGVRTVAVEEDVVDDRLRDLGYKV